jgi:hypothetical protein
MRRLFERYSILFQIEDLPRSPAGLSEDLNLNHHFDE